MHLLVFLKIPYKITERRAGDVASCYADPSLAEKELNWKTERSLEEMCKWNGQLNIVIVKAFCC